MDSTCLDLGPAVRMVMVLLASTDPLDLATGGRAETYATLATSVVEALRDGADVGDLLHLLRSADAADGGVEHAHAFARAAWTWWTVDASRRGLVTAA